MTRIHNYDAKPYSDKDIVIINLFTVQGTNKKTNYKWTVKISFKKRLKIIRTGNMGLSLFMNTLSHYTYNYTVISA